MATAKLKCTLPGVIGYAAGDLRLALFANDKVQDAAALASNISLTPDATEPDTYWGQTAGFADLCRARITDGATLIGSGYMLMDDTDGVHILVNQPSVSVINGTQINTTAAVATLVINATAPALSTIAADGSLGIHRGDYTEFELTLGNVVDRAGEKLIFTLKPRKDDEDDDLQAYLQVTETSGAVLVNGSATGVVATDASLTVTNAATGVTRFIFKSDITDLLPIGTNFWLDVQRIAADGERHTMYERRASVTRDVTRRTE